MKRLHSHWATMFAVALGAATYIGCSYVQHDVAAEPTTDTPAIHVPPLVSESSDLTASDAAATGYDASGDLGSHAAFRVPTDVEAEFVLKLIESMSSAERSGQAAQAGAN